MLNRSALAPVAVLLFAVVLCERALAPIAVLSPPVVLLREGTITAGRVVAALSVPQERIMTGGRIPAPVVVLESASSPRNVLPLVSQPSSQTAPACGGSARQTRASGIEANRVKSRLAGHAVNRAAEATGRLIFLGVAFSWFFLCVFVASELFNCCLWEHTD